MLHVFGMGHQQLTHFEATEIPGQVVLPGFQELLNCEAQALAKPEHELFCVRFVEFGGDTAKTYQAIHPECIDRLYSGPFGQDNNLLSLRW